MTSNQILAQLEKDYGTGQTAAQGRREKFRVRETATMIWLIGKTQIYTFGKIPRPRYNRTRRRYRGPAWNRRRAWRGSAEFITGGNKDGSNQVATR